MKQFAPHISTVALPVMTDPLGKYWTQPADLPSKVVIDAEHALIEEAVFMTLPEYSSSIPSGVYVGKAWRRHQDDGPLFCWFDHGVKQGTCALHFRKALFV